MRPNTNTLVIKFGGKSLATPELIRNAALTVSRARKDGHRVACVVSATGKTTEQLIEMLRGLGKQHPALWDLTLSYGERTSAALLADALTELGEANRIFDPQFPHWPILTDSEFGNASPKLDSCQEYAPALEQTLDSEVAVIPGFIGKDSSGNITTLGRGGSDLTAFLIAKLVAADEVVKLTDVEGVYWEGALAAELHLPQLLQICKADAGKYESINAIIQPKALQFFSSPTRLRVVTYRKMDAQAQGTIVYPQ